MQALSNKCAGIVRNMLKHVPRHVFTPGAGTELKWRENVWAHVSKQGAHIVNNMQEHMSLHPSLPGWRRIPELKIYRDAIETSRSAMESRRLMLLGSCRPNLSGKLSCASGFKQMQGASCNGQATSPLSGQWRARKQGKVTTIACEMCGLFRNYASSAPQLCK